VDAALAKAREALLAVQEADGSFGDPDLGVPPNVGHTAMAVRALVAATPATAVGGDEAIAKGLRWLAGKQDEKGAIFDNPQYVNYMTSAAVGAFAAARRAEHRQVETKARDFLASTQYADQPGEASYGGFPYKDRQVQSADLSNFQFAIEALADAGLPSDHPVWERARTYLSRVQNRSESNDLVVTVQVGDRETTMVPGDDEGAIYRPGASQAGVIERSDGTVEGRSYGSMTYALLKCLVLAGVSADDPRMIGALGWLTRNFTLERNPGFEGAEEPEKAGQQGYYYYLVTMARALGEYERLTKAPLKVVDAAGKAHDWRKELCEALLQRVGEDGRWTNPTDRWQEGSPVLVTSYAVLALAEASGRFR
jgi:squalene-hopene/tetraprenyl-beta-curcumene cyclase